MKRKLALMLAVAALSMGLFVGCSAPAEDTTPEETVVEENAQEEVTEEVSAEPAIYTDGTYEGAAEGFHGDIKVKVEVAEGRIASVEILEQTETEGIGAPATEEIAQKITDAQSTEVDLVSGATFSSEGTIAAVKNAVEGK